MYDQIVHLGPLKFKKGILRQVQNIKLIAKNLQFYLSWFLLYSFIELHFITPPPPYWIKASYNMKYTCTSNHNKLCILTCITAYIMFMFDILYL